MNFDKNIKELLRKPPLASIRENLSKFVNLDLINPKNKSDDKKAEKRDSMVSYLDEESFKKEIQ